ncbi:unnamed protein product [Didymodactylos carnosus]|uniref:BCAS3 WD40 domain-containing protein n=1 Tax=Didymodactylos carnosus TaxID=1234261 RepID=A0A8S2CTI2_9BILA|nr:unnamed protein product [Didymodactylos carnosus]CAF3511725.1 unnamed protein product [Didymodactylos carnosus]
MSNVTGIELRKVRPEAVNDRSVLESVVDFLQDVVEKVPQAYTTSRVPNTEQLEPIEWLRFMQNAQEWHPNLRYDTLVLIIGFKTGVQLWTIDTNGIALELFSIKEHNISSSCLLFTPHNRLYGDDPYINQRPLIVFTKSIGSPSIQIRSLKYDHQHQHVKTILLQTESTGIDSNKYALVCSTQASIIGYDLVKFEEKFLISTCYANNLYHNLKLNNPFALSTRWLAFVDYRLNLGHQSQGGINTNEPYSSYTGVVLNAAKSLSKSVVKIGESVLNTMSSQSSTMASQSNLTDSKPSTSVSLQQQKHHHTSTNSSNSTTTRHRNGSGKDDSQAGIVTIVDTLKLFGSSIHDDKQNWIVAHFQAHSEPVSYLHFNPSGHLLVTCDDCGHYFNVLEIQTSPYRCTRTYVKHLYTLFRGDTDCKIAHMTFTYDSRWLAVSTKRGTTHLFAMNPYGGSVNIRTHSKAYVVNKASRYHRTAGLDDHSHVFETRRSYATNNEQTKTEINSNNSSAINKNNSTNYNKNSKQRTNDSLLLPAVTLIRQPTDGLTGSLSAPFNVDCLCLAAIFGVTRAFINPEDSITHQEQRPCYSFFVISWHGRLIEYVLEPGPDTTKNTRVTSETPLILTAYPKAQWPLQKCTTWPEVRMELGYAALSQGNTFTRPSSATKINFKDDWLRQVEMNTHVGPARRLWMGPQFQFKTYSEATVSVCHPNSSVFTADLPQNSMNLVEADLKSLPMQWSKSTPVQMPNMQKDISPAYIEVGSGSFQDAPSLSIYGSSFDSLKSDFEVELVEKLFEAANDSTLKNGSNGDNDSLCSSTCSSTIRGQNSMTDMIPSFPDADAPD